MLENSDWVGKVWIVHQVAAGRAAKNASQLPKPGEREEAWASWQFSTGQLPGRPFSACAWKGRQIKHATASRKILPFSWSGIHSCSASFLLLAIWAKSYPFWATSRGKFFYVNNFKQYSNPIKRATSAFYINRSILCISNLQLNSLTRMAGEYWCMQCEIQHICIFKEIFMLHFNKKVIYIYVYI